MVVQGVIGYFYFSQHARGIKPITMFQLLSHASIRFDNAPMIQGWGVRLQHDRRSRLHRWVLDDPGGNGRRRRLPDRHLVSL